MKSKSEKFGRKIAEFSYSFSQKTRWSSLQISQFINACLATDFALSSDQYLRSVFETAPTVYDKAMDSWREVSGHLGYDHRIFDGGHSVSDAWNAVKGALPDDSLKEEALGFLQAYWKDTVTPMGMPLTTLNKDYFDWASNGLSSFGAEREYLLDLVSFTATESTGALAAVIGASLNWKKSDIEEFSAHASATAFTSAFAANPLAITVSIILMARSYHVGKREGRLGKIFKQFGWGAGKSAAFIGAAGLVGGSAWVGVVAGLAAAVVVEKIKVKYSDNDEIYTADFMSDNIVKNITPEIKALVSRNATT